MWRDLAQWLCPALLLCLPWISWLGSPPATNVPGFNSARGKARASMAAPHTFNGPLRSRCRRTKTPHNEMNQARLTAMASGMVPVPHHRDLWAGSGQNFFARVPFGRPKMSGH